MAEYIEREKVLQVISEWHREDINCNIIDYLAGWNEAIEQLECNIREDIPTADVAPVVFCKDCVNCGHCSVEDTMSFARLPEDRCFCGVGKRKK